MPFIKLPEGEINKSSSLVISQVISQDIDYIAIADIAKIDGLVRSVFGTMSTWLIDLTTKDGETRRYTPIGNFGKTREEIQSNIDKINSVIGVRV